MSTLEAIIQSNLCSKVTKLTGQSGRIVNVEIGEIRLFRIADSQGLLSFRSLKSGLFATSTIFRLSVSNPLGAITWWCTMCEDQPSAAPVVQRSRFESRRACRFSGFLLATVQLGL